MVIFLGDYFFFGIGLGTLAGILGSDRSIFSCFFGFVFDFVCEGVVGKLVFGGDGSGWGREDVEGLEVGGEGRALRGGEEVYLGFFRFGIRVFEFLRFLVLGRGFINSFLF